jgi:hypothetical protein
MLNHKHFKHFSNVCLINAQYNVKVPACDSSEFTSVHLAIPHCLFIILTTVITTGIESLIQKPLERRFYFILFHFLHFRIARIKNKQVIIFSLGEDLYNFSVLLVELYNGTTILENNLGVSHIVPYILSVSFSNHTSRDIHENLPVNVYNTS